MNVQTIVDANFPQPQVASPPTIVMNGVRWETSVTQYPATAILDGETVVPEFTLCLKRLL